MYKETPKTNKRISSAHVKKVTEQRRLRKKAEAAREAKAVAVKPKTSGPKAETIDEDVQCLRCIFCAGSL